MIARRTGMVVLLSFVTSYAVADVTGTWSGSISGPLACNGVPSVTQSFSVTLSLLQTGTAITGDVEVTGRFDACVAGSPTQTIDFPLSGTISGSTLAGTFPDGNNTGQFTATVSGSSMSVTTISGGGNPLTGTLTQTSTQPPASGFSGTYNGTYNSTVTVQGCTNLSGSLSSSGPFTVSISQVGNVVAGVATLTASKDYANDGTGNCTIIIADGGGPFSGTINGNVLSAPLVNEHGQVEGTITATFSGNNLSGTAVTTRDQVTFTASRTSAGLPPIVSSFTANPSSISAGDASTLSWATINASSVSIDNRIGTQAPSGSVNVLPAQTTTYTLTANGPGGTASASVTVTVAAAAPRIVVGTLPAGMLQATGSSGATDSFALSNVGTAPGSITLTQSGNFFTVAPNSFTLAPRASQMVGITANTQNSGTYDGTITISPNGITVPVHLLVAAPPTAPVNPQATMPRSDVSLPAGQNPSGSVSFKNNGSGTLVGIAVADVPWIVPQTGTITIAPGQTQQISFNIDRSKRPDNAAPSGGVVGTISLVYLTGAFSKGLVALGSAPTGSVSVTIVDVVKPNVASGTPPPLQSGEVALFIDNLGTTNRFNGDLSISSRALVPSIADLQVFQFAGANPTQLSAIPSFSPNAGISFPAITRNVFGIAGGGPLQLRSSQAANLSLSAVVALNGSNPSISSATALPILRSDRSVGAGERLVFTGAENSQTANDALATSFSIQEVTGNAGHVSLEYRDANGAIVGTDSGDVPAFRALGGGTPAGTRSIIATNDSTTAARFAGYAVINDDTTGDGWVLTDPSRQWGSASGPLIVPLVSTRTGAQTDVYVMNTSNTSASVTVAVDTTNRRRAVRATGATSPQASTVAPMSTAVTTVASPNGFVRITSTASISAAGRITTSASGGLFGSSLPAVPVSASLAASQGRRFTGVDDSSSKTVAAATAATYRATLMLIETAAENATVRVTLRYNFVAGSTVSAHGISSRDFSMGPNQMLTIADLARSIIGAQRDAFGDLRNMQVDVDVIDGSGKVLPFLEAMDNASGDIMVRAE